MADRPGSEGEGQVGVNARGLEAGTRNRDDKRVRAWGFPTFACWNGNAKGDGGNQVALITSVPLLPESECAFSRTGKGVRDIYCELRCL